jgi:glycosyltransferase involved in cell wall biosynthesis
MSTASSNRDVNHVALVGSYLPRQCGIGTFTKDIPFVDPSFYKDQFGVEERTVLLTFGLIGPGKGVEYVLEALPRIVRQHPDVVYLIVGATHPHVARMDGESYRNHLERTVDRLGLRANVVFDNRFVTSDELWRYLGAADVYITPYLIEEQITSGTLAYAVGAGKAVISTPYWYAEELLADGRGLLIPFRNADAIADSVLALLDDPVHRNAMRKRAYLYCRTMVWKQVARKYLELGSRVIQERVKRPSRFLVFREVAAYWCSVSQGVLTLQRKFRSRKC